VVHGFAPEGRENWRASGIITAVFICGSFTALAYALASCVPGAVQNLPIICNAMYLFDLLYCSDTAPLWLWGAECQN
jgi:hypothetical protein